MRENIKELIDKYQIRKTFKQKTEFINWLENKTLKLGYELEIDQYSSKGRNLVVGNPTTAKVILTAHYDTQPNFYLPMIAGINWFGFIISQIYMIALIFAVLGIFDFLVIRHIDGLLSIILSILMPMLIIVQIYVGKANKHTVNDNTSGIATLLSIMEDVKEEDREKVCFVFFDQEELGLIGSSKFSSKYALFLRDKPLINFDCVANGKNIVYICKKEFRESKYINILEKSVESNKREDKDYLIGSAIKYVYPSDQIHFKSGVGVAALKKAPILGYYLNGIHNSRDKIFMEENVENIKETMIYFIQNI